VTSSVCEQVISILSVTKGSRLFNRGKIGHHEEGYKDFTEENKVEK